jgi:hypothetical protein
VLVGWQRAIFCHNRRFSPKRDDAARVLTPRKSVESCAGFHGRGGPSKCKTKRQFNLPKTSSDESPCSRFHFVAAAAAHKACHFHPHPQR